MVNLNPTILITTLNVNALSIAIKGRNCKNG